MSKRNGGDIVQALTIKIRIASDNTHIFRCLSHEYIRIVNSLAGQAWENGSFPKVTTKHLTAALPSAVLNQAIRDAKSVYRKSKKQHKLAILRKPSYFVNNQNYAIGDETVAFPILVDGKTKKTVFPAIVTDRDRQLLKGAKLGLLRLVEKSGKWYTQISIETPDSEPVQSGATMGVDLGLKVPAVVATSNGKIRFFGNGRQNKYIRRHYGSRRRRLGKLKKLSAIRKLGNKEQRWMTDQNHKISRQIVNFAVQHGISVIKLERLKNIRNAARTSRKNAKNLHNWSFYQLQTFIQYKANMAGIQVMEVSPAYTSQACPNCRKRNKAKDRDYQCSCGFHSHRDRVGAINIMNQPVADGNSLSA